MKAIFHADTCLGEPHFDYVEVANHGLMALITKWQKGCRKDPFRQFGFLELVPIARPNHFTPPICKKTVKSITSRRLEH